MIRHGQASFGEADYDRLSPTGLRQARIVASHLCQLTTRFDAVYAGTLARQQETARAMVAVYRDQLVPLPSLQTIPELDEYDAAKLWQHLYAPVTARYPELAASPSQLRRDPKIFQRLFSRIVASWVAGTYPSRSLESWPAFRSRVTRGVRQIIQTEGTGKRIALFTSAGPVAIAVQMATAISDAHCVDLAWQVFNASLTRFRYHEKRFTLTGFNDVAALEMAGGAQMLTYR